MKKSPPEYAQNTAYSDRGRIIRWGIFVYKNVSDIDQQDGNNTDGEADALCARELFAKDQPTAQGDTYRGARAVRREQHSTRDHSHRVGMYYLKDAEDESDSDTRKHLFRGYLIGHSMPSYPKHEIRRKREQRGDDRGASDKGRGACRARGLCIHLLRQHSECVCKKGEHDEQEPLLARGLLAFVCVFFYIRVHDERYDYKNNADGICHRQRLAVDRGRGDKRNDRGKTRDKRGDRGRTAGQRYLIHDLE